MLRSIGSARRGGLPRTYRACLSSRFAAFSVHREWEQEYADLKTQRDSDYTKLKNTRAEVAELQKIRKCVDIALKAEQPEQTQNRTKRHDIDR